MKKLYIDFDGVILDTITLLYKYANENGYDKSDNKFYEQFDYKTILKDEYILNDSINCIQKLIDSGMFDVNILTHCNSIREGADKVKYIRKYFKDITVIICPKDISKTKMVHTKGAILVDDYAGNLREWEKEGGVPVRFSLKLNGKGYPAIDRLDKLLEMYGEVECK